MKLARALIAVCAAALSIAAHAHAFFDHAEPRVGSVVPSAPGQVRIWFTQELEPAFSTAQVTDASGNGADAGPAHVDAHDPMVIDVPLSKLGPGEYTVTWRAVSVDTHVTQGHFSFRVGQQ
ncbi:MAG TPA: copper resistance CopC family protein [Ramlibacter sp.]|nr:copper resistance CopC family protein [Ramlibacter sp.]